jgi:hypothetical protein
MMEAVSTSETSVDFCETVQRTIPEDSYLQLHSLTVSPLHPPEKQLGNHWLLLEMALSLERIIRRTVGSAGPACDRHIAMILIQIDESNDPARDLACTA